jgi:hypothetical protein
MHGFKAKNWVILPQTVKEQGVEMEVACKACYLTPLEDKLTGDISFGRFPNWSYRVLLADVRTPGDVVQVKLHVHTEKGYPVKLVRFAIVDPVKGINSDQWYNPPVQRNAKKTVKPKPSKDDIANSSIADGEAFLVKRFGDIMGRLVYGLLMQEASADEEKKAA